MGTAPHHHIQKLYLIKLPKSFSHLLHLCISFSAPSVQITQFPLCRSSNLLIFLALATLTQCLFRLPWKLALELEEQLIGVLHEGADRNPERDVTQREHLGPPFCLLVSTLHCY